jgi:hypothetical protein
LVKALAEHLELPTIALAVVYLARLSLQQADSLEPQAPLRQPDLLEASSEVELPILQPQAALEAVASAHRLQVVVVCSATTRTSRSQADFSEEVLQQPQHLSAVARPTLAMHLVNRTLAEASSVKATPRRPHLPSAQHQLRPTRAVVCLETLAPVLVKTKPRHKLSQHREVCLVASVRALSKTSRSLVAFSAEVRAQRILVEVSLVSKTLRHNSRAGSLVVPQPTTTLEEAYLVKSQQQLVVFSAAVLPVLEPLPEACLATSALKTTSKTTLEAACSVDKITSRSLVVSLETPLKVPTLAAVSSAAWDRVTTSLKWAVRCSPARTVNSKTSSPTTIACLAHLAAPS